MRYRIGWAGALALSIIFSLGTAAPVRAQKIALTVDDLPETGDLPPDMSRAQIAARITKALKDAHAPQVYGFVNAGTLDDPDVAHLLERWRAAGFLLGNHTWSHYSADEKPLAVYERDIARNEPVLRKLMVGQDWHWFRYPFLAEGATLERRVAIRKYLSDHGYKIAEVTIDFEDHAFNDPYARCIAKGDNASIVRMHTLYMDAAKESIRLSRARSQMLFHREISYVMLLHFGSFEAVMLPQLLDLLKQQGFTLVTLPEAQADPVYALDPGMVNDGGTFLDDLMQASTMDDAPHPELPTPILEKMCK
ncbi:Peptidoglycan/xylan/chitin deacetylase, PgdA/CDA1 family [Granulicella rosea]|uniref:Peptidoglycan/xylan/chitin deacetylase, PgdA/CDA1 family n=1 Tax=Granulicella rosea TaxID=474952 RepID=A0A239IJU0_9BACT|nr:polysaccharide deacetylase family protein [Granulicella rosea]SNS93835.1 Peptidoglycan/xylan/chitin deacetylase, PgdA/CDA1 family [Granulicella rosea]